MNNSLVSYEEESKDNSLILAGIGIVSANMKNPLEYLAKRTGAQGAGSTKAEGGSAFWEVDFKGRNTVLAYQESYEEALHRLDDISPASYRMDNPKFRSFAEGFAFQLFVGLTLETALRNGKGGEITARVIDQRYPDFENENAEKTVKIYAEYFGDGNGVSCLYSGGKHYAFVSRRVILAPIKGLDSTVLYDWNWSGLSAAEKRAYTSWLNQILGADASDFHRNLVRAVKVWLGIDPEEGADPNVTFENRPADCIAGGLDEVKGVFNKIHTDYDLSQIKMTENIGCIPFTKSVKKPDDTETVESRIGDATVLAFTVPGIDEGEMEQYNCLIPLGSEGIRGLREQGFTIVRGEVNVINELLLVRLFLNHSVTDTEVSIEHRYKNNHIKILQAFPHLVAKTWLSDEVCGGKVQADIYSYNKISDEVCEPRLERADFIGQNQRIRIACDDLEFSRIPETFYRSSNTGGDFSEQNMYYLYSLKAMPDMLPFVYSEGGRDAELGCLMTNYRASRLNIAKRAVIGVDLGTCNSLVSLCDADGGIRLADIVRPEHFYSISYIPESMKAALEKFYRLCISYDSAGKQKIRTAAVMYAPEAEIRNSVHKDGTLFLLNSATMNILENAAPNGEERTSGYVETDIKFGGAQRPEVLLTFLRELLYPVLSEQIAQGVVSFEINVSYPNEGLKDVVNTAWVSLISEMRKWPVTVNNKVTIQDHVLWTEAAAVANYTLHMPAVIAAAHIGFCNVDIGDGTTDISCFTPSGNGRKFEFKNQLSVKYAADDIVIDSLVHLFADQKRTRDRYKAIYGQPDGTEFSRIWQDDGSDECRKNIERAAAILSGIDPENEMYRTAKEHERLRNELLTLIEEYGIDRTKLSEQLKALLILRYGALFYTVACYLKEILCGTKINGTFPVYLYGGGSKGLNLLVGSGKTLSNSAVGTLFRNMIAQKIECDPEYIELEMRGGSEKNEVALGLVQPLHEQLSSQTVKPEREQKAGDLSDGDFWDDDEGGAANLAGTGENSLYGEALTVSQEVDEINDKIMKDYMKTLFMANRNADACRVLLKQEGDGWLYTVLQSGRFLKIIAPKNPNECCYVSETENKRIMSKLHAQRSRDYGNTGELPQKIRLCYQAARMVDQYLIKVSSKSCQE